MKNNFFILITILFLTYCSDSIVDPTNNVTEEYSIYKEILLNWFNNSTDTIILKDYTESERFDTSNVEKLCASIAGLRKETIMNYIKVNNEITKLNRVPGINSVLLSEYDNTLKKFNKVFLSRVGYNSSYTQAIITMVEFTGYMDAGRGVLFVLEKKENGNWQVMTSRVIWIS